MPVSALKKLKGSLKAAGLVGPTAPKKIKKSSSGKSDIPGYKAKLAHLSESLAKNNPFELKFARPKHAILNKKVKGVTGRPSATRKRSQEVREKTLRVERGNSGRDSTLVDKRFGESNTALSLEDKMLERFMRERKTTKGGNSKGLYNLAEETGEELTHMGQSLSADMDAMGFQRVQDQEDEEEGNLYHKCSQWNKWLTQL